MSDLIIKQLEKDEEIPWKLLLLADPSKDLIEKYLPISKIHIGKIEEKVVGEYVLTPITSLLVELKNIAVDKNFQGKGYGKRLALDAIQKAKETGYKQIEVGTGNSSLSQLALYQKCSFRITSIERDFFTKNYNEKIVENGIVCQDMIRLSIIF